MPSTARAGRAGLVDAAHGNEDALDPIVEVIHDLVDDLDEHGSGKMRAYATTHALCLMALGDALDGRAAGRFAGAAAIPARDMAEKMLVDARGGGRDHSLHRRSKPGGPNLR
jgi:hypothetical protein